MYRLLSFSRLVGYLQDAQGRQHHLSFHRSLVVPKKYHFYSSMNKTLLKPS